MNEAQRAKKRAEALSALQPRMCPACKDTLLVNRGAFKTHVRCCSMPPEEKFWRNVVKGDGCWEYVKSAKPDGYRFFRYRTGIGGKGTQVQWYAHRYSYTLAYGTIPAGLEVAHRCDNRGCVRPDHLFLATHVENMLDCKAKGRQSRGAGTKLAKLSEADVLEIKLNGRMGAGGNVKEYAARHKVRPGTICAILAGRAWTHILLPQGER